MSKYFRKLALKKFHKHYHISTGFCAVKYWTNKIQEYVSGLTQSIHNIHETFDFVLLIGQTSLNMVHVVVQDID